MTIIIWMILGITAGWIASTILRTHITQGLITDLVLGIVGALFGGLILTILGQPGLNELHLSSIVIILLGSIALIWFGRVLNAPAR